MFRALYLFSVQTHNDTSGLKKMIINKHKRKAVSLLGLLCAAYCFLLGGFSHKKTMTFLNFPFLHPEHLLKQICKYGEKFKKRRSSA